MIFRGAFALFGLLTYSFMKQNHRFCWSAAGKFRVLFATVNGSKFPVVAWSQAPMTTNCGVFQVEKRFSAPCAVPASIQLTWVYIGTLAFWIWAEYVVGDDAPKAHPPNCVAGWSLKVVW